MPAVITIDQRASRRGEDLVDRWIETLNRDLGDGLQLPFVALGGDELQGLVSDPAAVVEIVMRGARHRQWWVGIGIGAVEHPLRETAARSRGPAFYAARAAVAAAKRTAHGFAVRGDPQEQTRAVAACLRMLAFVTRRRGVNTKRWAAVDLMREGLTLRQIGDRLGISHQAVSGRLKTAGYEEELEGRWLATRLLAEAMAETGGA